MNKNGHSRKDQMKAQILNTLRNMPDEFVESFLEKLMWMLDDIWRREGIPEDLEARLQNLNQDGLTDQDETCD